jgi:protein-disulfide isomerase
MKTLISLLSCVSLSLISNSFAEETSKATEHFNSDEIGGIKKIVGEYLVENPEIIMTAFQAGMALKQKEEVAKMEQAVKQNRDKIFSDTAPVGGNLEGSESLVIFMDPYCGYCKKFHGEIDAIVNQNKDVKITFIDIPIMGPESTLAVQAMLAAKEQGKYEQLQKAIYSADKRLTKRDIIKMADSLGIDTNKLEDDMKSKAIKNQVDLNSDLAKELGVNGTPTLIIGESKVVPGFLPADEVNKMLKETVQTSEDEKTSEKSS